MLLPKTPLEWRCTAQKGMLCFGAYGAEKNAIMRNIIYFYVFLWHHQYVWHFRERAT